MKRVMIGLVLVALAMMGCSSSSTPSPSVMEPPDQKDVSGLAPTSDSPCTIADDMVGQTVRVAGEIAFVDATDPEGVYADLEADGCRVGLFVESLLWGNWSAEARSLLDEGVEIQAEGRLDRVPMPARPEESQLVIELTSPPQLLDLPGIALEFDLPPLDGPACDFDEVEFWEDVQVEGEIIFVDDSKAAGLYAELHGDGCLMRLWVERTRWDAWIAEEQEMFSVGRSVMTEGILTLVLGEPVVDLSWPPRAY